MTRYRCVFCGKEYSFKEMEERGREGRDYQVRPVPRCECGKSLYMKLREEVIRRVRAV